MVKNSRFLWKISRYEPKVRREMGPNIGRLQPKSGVLTAMSVDPWVSPSPVGSTVTHEDNTIQVYYKLHYMVQDYNCRVSYGASFTVPCVTTRANANVEGLVYSAQGARVCGGGVYGGVQLDSFVGTLDQLPRGTSLSVRTIGILLLVTSFTVRSLGTLPLVKPPMVSSPGILPWVRPRDTYRAANYARVFPAYLPMSKPTAKASLLSSVRTR